MKRISILIALLWSVQSVCGQTKPVEIEGYDRMRYSIEEITVAPGTTVELTLKTISDMPESQMAHNLVLLTKDTDVDAFVNLCVQYSDNGYIAPALTSKILARTGMLGGGEQETITFKAPSEPGRYTYVCTFPGHYVAGMKGVLIVQE